MPSIGFEPTYQGILGCSAYVIAIDIKKISCFVTRITVKILTLPSTIMTLFIDHLILFYN